MPNLSEYDKKTILKKIDYDNMNMFTSKIAARIGGAWDSVETYDALYADLLCKVTKNMTGPTFALKAMTGVFRVKTGPGATKAMEQVDAQFFGASAGTSVSATHAEANARATLSGGSVSVFDYHLSPRCRRVYWRGYKGRLGELEGGWDRFSGRTQVGGLSIRQRVEHRFREVIFVSKFLQAGLCVCIIMLSMI